MLCHMSRVPAEQRREQLIEATIDLAIREGLAAASVRRIADEANVSLGVVHYCFSSKEALLNAVAESFAAPILGPVAAAIEDGAGTLEERARRGFQTFLEVTKKAPGRQLLSYELAAWSIRGDGEAARLLYQTYLDVIEGFLTRGLGLQGTDALSTRSVARMVLTLTDGIALAWLVDGDEASARQQVDLFLGSILKLLRDGAAMGLLTIDEPDAPGDGGTGTDDTNTDGTGPDEPGDDPQP